MVLLGGCEPHSIVCRLVGLIPQYEDNLVPNVDSEATEHGASFGRQHSDRVKYKPMRDSLALLGSEQCVVYRPKPRIVTVLRHDGSLLILPALFVLTDFHVFYLP